MELVVQAGASEGMEQNKEGYRELSLQKIIIISKVEKKEIYLQR